ncbi:hypothetical protein XM78_c21190 [Vibrio vulnificus]|nr:hypothetical protein XM78_c21190 [Vibrio vulnificus]
MYPNITQADPLPSNPQNTDIFYLTHLSKLGTYLTITQSRSTNDNSIDSRFLN